MPDYYFRGFPLNESIFRKYKIFHDTNTRAFSERIENGYDSLAECLYRGILDFIYSYHETNISIYTLFLNMFTNKLQVSSIIEFKQFLFNMWRKDNNNTQYNENVTHDK